MAHPDELAREMAIEAATRGWLSSEQLWSFVRRSLAGESMQHMLEATLDGGQLALLRSASATVTEVHLTSSVPPPPSHPITIPQNDGPPSRDLGGLPTLSAVERYRTERLLGRGGAGRVMAVRDREIGRIVALKTLRDGSDADERIQRRFLMEARVTAQLEHPNIVPVYDLGVIHDGTPYYTMRIVQKQSLASVLISDALREEWPLVRMLHAFMQVCRAVAYAHSRGVLHGDIKPENILLGDFGEVYLADWGLTRVQPHSPVRTARSPSAPPPAKSSLLAQMPEPDDSRVPVTPKSRPGGTPGYVAPEVAYGDWSTIDHRADLFSLGVVLYEILTGEQPFTGRDARDVILATATETPLPPREIAPSCPLLLEDLCIELLDKDKDERPDSAEVVATRIENYLEGAKEKERRREEALRLCEIAEQPAGAFQGYAEVAAKLRREAAVKLDLLEPWQPVEDKRHAWEIEDRAAATEEDAARKLASALDLYTKALAYDNECARAHEGIADLYWDRAQQAEREGREPSRIYYEALVLEHDTGFYKQLMSAQSSLKVTTDPEGASLFIHRYEQKDRRRVLSEGRPLGTAPVKVELEPGSYVVIAKAEGFRDVRFPVHLVRGDRRAANINLYTDEEIGEGFIYVPGGTFIMGGDPEATDSLPRQQVHVDDFAIAELPVTVGDYCAFLNALDDEMAERRAPCNLREYVGAIVERNSAGDWVPHDSIIEGAEARATFPPSDGHLWHVPILLVTWFDARAFCRWRGVRLPREAEWEKAARGVDGRAFPWGDTFDATNCLMRESRKYPQQPEPAGTFPIDRSPYEVRDVAGGMREWVGDLYSERSADDLAAEDEPPLGSARGESSLRVIRSGGWRFDRNWSRCASRSKVMALIRGTGLSFRVAKDLPKRGR